MPTTRKNVRDYLKMTGCILLSLFISVVIIVFLIPDNIFYWITEHELEFRLIALGAVLFFLAYKTYRFIKRTEKPWQTFKVAGWILLSLFIAVIAISFLTHDIVLLVAIWFIADYGSEIGWISLGVFLFFLAYKTYRFIKRTENPWQTFKGNLKKNLIIYFSFAFTIYACMALVAIQFPTEYGSCDFYNKELGGGQGIPRA